MATFNESWLAEILVRLGLMVFTVLVLAVLVILGISWLDRHPRPPPSDPGS